MKSFKPPDLKITDAVWNTWSVQERAVQIARYFADTQKVREHGVNRGFWVEKFLASVGLGGGYAWCAAFVNWCLQHAGWTQKIKGAGAVRNWIRWARETNRTIAHDKIERGCLMCYMTSLTQGHMGIIVRVEKVAGTVYLHTIEGNTNEAGAREGDGVYRKRRLLDKKFVIIKWW